MIQAIRSSMLTLGAGLLLLASGAAVHAQERIYRCGNEYTNDAAMAKQRGCKVMEGGNVTIVQGTRASGGSSAAGNAAVVTAPSSAPRVDADQQRARDADARAILENEMRRAQVRQAELQKEYNNGQPERMGSEARNYQKYIDRTADLKASLERNQSDMDGIQRELSRLQSK